MENKKWGDEFNDYLKKSDEFRECYGKHLLACGYEIFYPETQLYKGKKYRMQTKDEGDIKIIKPDYGWINVKKLSPKNIGANFTCLDDWYFQPPRYKQPNFIVCSVSSFEEAKEKPKCIITSNCKQTHLAIVESSTKDYWWEEERTAQWSPQLFYVCLPELAIFIPFVFGKKDPLTPWERI